jgi:hypothetical protein
LNLHYSSDERTAQGSAWVAAGVVLGAVDFFGRVLGAWLCMARGRVRLLAALGFVGAGVAAGALDRRAVGAPAGRSGRTGGAVGRSVGL